MIKETSLGVAAQITAAATALLSLPIYAKYLGAEQFSLVLLFSTIQAWLSLVDGGFSTALTQYIAKGRITAVGPETISTVVRSLIACIIGISALLVVSILLAIDSNSLPLFSGEYRNEEELGTAFILIVILGLSRVVEAVLRGALQGYQDFSFFYFSQIICNFVKTGSCIVVLLLTSQSVVTFFEVQLVVSALYLLLLVGRLRAKYRLSLFGVVSLRSLAPLWATASALFLNSLLLVASTQFDRAILAIYLEPTRFSEYLTAVLIASMIATIAGPINQVAFPTLQKVVSNGTHSSLQVTFQRSFALSFALTANLLLCLLTFGSPILSLLFSGTLDTHAVFFWAIPLSIAFSMSSLVGVPALLAVAAGRSRGIVGINFVNSITSVFLCIWLVPTYKESASILILLVTQLFSLAAIFLILPQFRSRLDDAMRAIKPISSLGVLIVTSFISVRLVLDRVIGLPKWFYILSAATLIILSLRVVLNAIEKGEQ